MIILSAGPEDEHFVGHRPMRWGSKHCNSSIVNFVRVFGQYATKTEQLQDLAQLEKDLGSVTEWGRPLSNQKLCAAKIFARVRLASLRK